MRLAFGKYRGRDIAEIPDDYVCWLALRKSYAKPDNRFETEWKVPIDVSIHARREMERRGYRRRDDHYEKEGNHGRKEFTGNTKGGGHPGPA